jgi:hypothetical protein
MHHLTPWPYVFAVWIFCVKRVFRAAAAAADDDDDDDD